MLIASTDPCHVLTKGTLTWHCFSTNVRMQLNLEHLPSSFGFLCWAAVGCEYTVLVVSDQINEASELRAFLGHYWRFFKEVQTPSTWKQSICDRHGDGSGGSQELNPLCSLPWSEKFHYCYCSTWHLPGLLQKPHTVPHTITVITCDGSTSDQLEAASMQWSCINIWGKAVSEEKWRDGGRIWPLKD